MLINTKKYLQVVKDIKKQIKAAQQRAILNANAELIALYWNIGKSINKHKKQLPKPTWVFNQKSAIYGAICQHLQ